MIDLLELTEWTWFTELTDTQKTNGKSLNMYINTCATLFSCQKVV